MTTTLTPALFADELLPLLERCADLSDAVVVITVAYGRGFLGRGTVVRASRRPGRRIIKLAYDWADVEPYSRIGLGRVRADILPTFLGLGAIMRARARQIQAEQKGEAA